VEPLVEVYREKRTVESYQHEVREKDTQLHQCQEDNKRLLAEKENPGGLTGLLATGLMDWNGIPPKDLRSSIGTLPGSFVEVHLAHSYRSTRTVAVVVLLEPIQGMQPWRAARAELVRPGRRTLRVYPPWQRESLSSDAKDRRVVIEADATEAEARGNFTLKVWNEDGTQSLFLSEVTFPERGRAQSPIVQSQ
jgi:uncharacterized protein (TIGR02268 family)